MPCARKYPSYEIRKLLQDAEGTNSPVTNRPAHSRSMHALATNPTVGGIHATTISGLKSRTTQNPGESNNAFKNRGGVGTASAFRSLLEQADAAEQALNSPIGQQALAVFDDRTKAGHRLRVTLNFAPIRQFGFLPASPSSGIVKSQKDPVTKVGSVDLNVKEAAGVRLILDAIGGSGVFTIQTCIPIDAMGASNFAINIDNV